MLNFHFITLFFVLFGYGRGAEFDFNTLRGEIAKRVGHGDTILRMIDASAKSLPDGILRGNFYSFGSFDECLAIKDNVTQGKYCYGTLTAKGMMKIFSHLSKEQQGILMHFNKVGARAKEISAEAESQAKKLGSNLMGFHFGICIPNTITSDELHEYVPFLDFDEQFCYSSEEPKLKTKHLVALGVIGGLVGIALVSTIFDVIISLAGKEPHAAILAFSLYSNSKRLLKSSTNDNQLLCINGLRTLNMMWVIFSHTYVHFALSGSPNNWLDFFDWKDDPKNMLVIGGTLSVDSFFTIAGILVVYIYMKVPDMDIKNSVKSVPLMYLHRYLRLTPALAVLILAYTTGLIKFLGDGPKWGLMQSFAVSGCENKWWSTLFYFQNYYGASDPMCLDQSWYLAVDMQLFLLSPLILIPLKKWPKFVLPLMVILVGVGVAVPFYIGYSNKFTGLVLGSTTATFIEEYYYKTHTRFGPYVIGMIAGFFIYKIKSNGKKLKLNIVVSLILWVVSIGTMIACIFDGYKLVEDHSDPLLDGLYLGLNRSIWSCALSIAIILCVSGNGGLINTFLSLPVMQLLSKLSYSMYLVHYLVILVGNLSQRTSVHFSNQGAVLTFFGYFIVTAAVSVVYSLLFESPMIILERSLFSRQKKSSHV